MINCLFVLLTLMFSAEAVSQEEITSCEIAFISEHYVYNSTRDTISLSVDNRNQVSFPSDEPTLFEIPPGEEVKVSVLEWAGEFRDPTSWYIFQILDHPDDSFIIPERWVFSQIKETEGRYLFTFKEE